MKYRIEELQPDRFNELETIASLAGMDESIDYDCTFFAAYNGGTKIYGFAGVNLNTLRYPQFEHIVLHPQAQKSRLSMILMNSIEDYLRKHNYKLYVCYILNTMNWMMQYAARFGFIPYYNDAQGVWFYKSLTKE